MTQPAPRRAAAVIAAVSLTATACTSGAGLSDAATSYLAIATPANRQLDRAFDALHGADRNDLAAAVADLRAISSAERAFDRRLRNLHLTAAEPRTMRTLLSANESRADLTTHVASSTSLDALHASEPQLAAADASVEVQVRILRRQLGLPPPESS